MDQFRWINPSQPGRLVQATQMLYFLAFFDVFNAVISGGSFALVMFVLALLKAGGGWGIANDKKLGYYAACVGAALTVLLDLYFLTASPVFGLIGLAISVWLCTLLFHESSRSHARIWFE